MAFGQLFYSHENSVKSILEFTFYLQISSHSFNEEHPAILPCVLKSSTFHLISDSRDNIFNFIISKQTWDLTRSQQIVDQHEETLLWNLRVRQQEHSADVF